MKPISLLIMGGSAFLITFVVLVYSFPLMSLLSVAGYSYLAAVVCFFAGPTLFRPE